MIICMYYYYLSIVMYKMKLKLVRNLQQVRYGVSLLYYYLGGLYGQVGRVR